MNKQQYFVCSVGSNHEGYTEENLDRMIEHGAFVFHEDTTQRGHYREIQDGDILILKYNNQFIAYGEKCSREVAINGEDGWNQIFPIREWIFHDDASPRKGVSHKGLQDNTLKGAGQMGTVKMIKPSFGYKSIESIHSENELFERMKELHQNNLSSNDISVLKKKRQIILQGPPGTGKTYSAKDIAEEMIFGEVSEDKREQKKRLETSEQFQLTQFHPSYSYEDFVRGIEASSGKDGIQYNTKNRILADFADKALKNVQLATLEKETFSKEQHVYELLTQFADQVQEKIDNDGRYPITDSVYISEVSDKGFRYTGDNWGNAPRIKFEDLVQIELLQAHTRQAIKHADGLSGLADHHATYFNNLSKKFRDAFPSELNNMPSTHKEQPTVKNFVLIIDEINRANLPSVMGELIYALEYRGEAVESMYAVDGDRRIIIPDNLYIIGTMNTADRSVGHIDYAIRRRFAFIDMLPNEKVITEGEASELFHRVSELFVTEEGDKKENAKYLAPDFDYKEIQLGHSYFMAETTSDLKMKLEYEIKPILREYVKDGILQPSATEIIEALDVHA
ncbi:AAA family ATPase [Halosquirtibacter xylanolyticus]|uniref:AAA family ATPase n=1 Tax=Halosquirtibacter xylanolyticus TaxID=3374599 RepID=UPI003749F41A|nr:AAA family ATPase [Prolixibacteraceae bacterium]